MASLHRELMKVLQERRSEETINSPLVVVDVGIGKNAAPTTFDLSEMLESAGFTDATVWGIDNNEAYVRRARERLSNESLGREKLNIRFEKGDFDLGRLGLLNVDMIVVSNVLLDLYYSEEQQKNAIEKMLSVLAPHGILVISKGPMQWGEQRVDFVIYSHDGSKIREASIFLKGNQIVEKNTMADELIQWRLLQSANKATRDFEDSIIQKAFEKSESAL